MPWTLSDAKLNFPKYHHAWDDLNASACRQGLLDSMFVQALLDHLADSQVLLAQDLSSSAAAMLLLVRGGAGRWQTFAPSQQPLGNALFADPSRAEAQIASLLHRLPGWPWVLSLMHQDPANGGAPRPHQPKGQTEAMDSLVTGRVTRAASFEAYWAQRPAELRDGLARRRRRLTQQGVAERLSLLRDPGDVEAALRHHSRLESQGWKAAAGTAVSLDSAQGRFYAQVFQAFCARGEAVMAQLHFNDEVVASQLCLKRGKVCISLKIAFDESRRRDAPGYLLQAQLIRQMHQDAELDSIEFFGPATLGWTHKWTQDLRSLHHLNVYRHPALRQAAQWHRALRQAPRVQADPPGPPQP